MVKYANVFFVHCIQALGGVETYLWEIAKKYHTTTENTRVKALFLKII